MDLSTIKPSERIVEILHPATKEPIGIRVSLVHIEDESMKRLKRQIQDDRLRLESKGKFIKSDVVEENTKELAFTAMKSWEWYNPTGISKKENKGFDELKRATWKGEAAPEFSKKNVFDVFETLPWFLNFICAEIGDSEAFFPG